MTITWHFHGLVITLGSIYRWPRNPFKTELFIFSSSPTDVEYHKTIDRPVFFYVTWFTASLSCMSMSRSYNSVTAADCINFLWNLSKPCKWTEKNGSRLAVGVGFLGKGQLVSYYSIEDGAKLQQQKILKRKKRKKKEKRKKQRQNLESKKKEARWYSVIISN